MKFFANIDIHEDYLRSVVFGFQDALVSTTGVVAGVAAGTSSKELVLLAGIVTITVESLSMGVGQYMSEKAVHQMDKEAKHTDNLFIVGGLMAASYFLGGVPLVPILFLHLPVSATVSVAAALFGLFFLGYVKAHIVKVSAFHSAAEMFLLGGAATVIGLLVGRLFRVVSP